MLTGGKQRRTAHEKVTANPRRRRLRHRSLPLLLGVLALTLAACGSTSPSASKTSTSSSKALQKPNPVLKVGVGSVNVSYGPFWVAMAKGLFTKDGVDVKVVSYNTAANTADIVSSGEDDVQLFSPALGYLLLKQGINIQYIYNLASFTSATNAIISSKTITSVTQLKSRGSTCRFASTATASIPYVSAISYSKLEGLNCQLVQLPTVPAEVAAVSSGSSQLASVPYTSALTAASAGQVNFLVNPLHMTAKVTKGLVSAPYPVFVVLGKSSLLQANHVAVTRFVKALRQGAAEMANMSNSELGAMCAKLAAFAGQKATLITKGWEAVHSQLSVGTKAGYISSSTWNHAKQGFSKWDLPGYTATSPLMSYAKVVNMSFWKNAS